MSGNGYPVGPVTLVRGLVSIAGFPPDELAHDTVVISGGSIATIMIEVKV